MKNMLLRAQNAFCCKLDLVFSINIYMYIYIYIHNLFLRLQYFGNAEIINSSTRLHP